MSDDWYELQRLEAEDEYLTEISKQAVEDFQYGRLQSYYRAHPHLAEKAFGKLNEARSLLPSSANAALVFAMSSIEVGFKSIVIRPIMAGLIHNESLAEFVMESFVKNSKADGVLDIVNRVLNEFASIDLKRIVLPSHSKSYWDEILKGQKWRNAVVHRAETYRKEDAELVIDLANHLWTDLFPALLQNIGLHTHENVVCPYDSGYCKDLKKMQTIEEEQRRLKENQK